MVEGDIIERLLPCRYCMSFTDGTVFDVTVLSTYHDGLGQQQTEDLGKVSLAHRVRAFEAVSEKVWRCDAAVYCIVWSEGSLA